MAASANDPRSDAFELNLRTRVVYGSGTVARLGELARGVLGVDASGASGKRVLLVTDPGVAAAGHAGRGRAALEEAGFRVEVFQDVRENPTTLDVDRCLEVTRDWRPELLCGLGGGSSLDVAKGTNFLHVCGGEMKDFWGVGKAGRPLLPLLAVPTTAGTGSEAQSFALIADEETHQKMACGDPHAAAAVALLDPELTLTQPRVVTACTGLDAIGHAVETAVTRKRNPASRLFSFEAFRLLSGAFHRVLSHPDDIEARGAMLRGATFAGLAIENSMLGAAHSLANPLTKHLGLPHGQAVAVALPHVVAYNAEDADARALYEGLAELLPGDHAGGGVQALVDALNGFLRATELSTKVELANGQVAELAAEAEVQWTAQFNPRPIEREAFERVLERIAR